MTNDEEAKQHILKALQLLHKLENIPGSLCIPIGEIQLRLVRCYQLLFVKPKEITNTNKVELTVKHARPTKDS